MLLTWFFSCWCWLGGSDVRSAWAYFFFFRHCHPVWAADCEPCRPRSVNLWRIGFLAPPTPPCHEAPGSAPRGRAAPPPESPAPPSYAACTCRVRECLLLVDRFFLLPCIFINESSERDLWGALGHPSPESFMMRWLLHLPHKSSLINFFFFTTF